MQKIQTHLSKQKNYTEANKVQQFISELTEKNKVKYLKAREEKILT